MRKDHHPSSSKALSHKKGVSCAMQLLTEKAIQKI